MPVKPKKAKVEWGVANDAPPPTPPLPPDAAALVDGGTTISRFHPQYGVLVDEMGIMHTRANIEHLLKQCQQHLKHSSLELEAIGRRTLLETHPRMANQFNYDYFS